LKKSTYVRFFQIFVVRVCLAGSLPDFGFMCGEPIAV
jgi:hypothetical protein